MNKNNLTSVLYRGWMNKTAVVLLLLLTTGLIFATVQTNCVYFPRLSGNYISTQVPLQAGDFTMEAWVYPMEPLIGGNPDRLEIFGGHLGSIGNSGYDFGTNVNRNVIFRNRTSTGVTVTTGNAPLPLFQWSHVAVIWGIGGTSPNGIYINGVFDQSIDLILDDPLPALGFKLGEDAQVLNLYKGRMDEFRHWNCKREQADIVANMNLSITSPQPNLLQSYPFTEGQYTVTRNYAVPMSPGQFAMLGSSVQWIGSPTPPTVTTQAATLVGEDSATLNGTLSSVGSDYPVIGFVWNTTGNPTYAYPMVDPYHYWGPVNTTGPFSYSVTGLTPGQTYYVRAWGANGGGFGYGGEISFTTTSAGYNINISTGNIDGVRIYTGTTNYGIDPILPIVLPAGYNGTFQAEKENYVFSLAPGSNSNIINNLNSDRNITFTGTFIYADLAGYIYTADPNIPLDVQPGSLETLTVPLPLNPLPSAKVMVFTGSHGTDLKIDLPAGTWYVIAYYDDPSDGGLGWHRSSSYPQNGGFTTFANLPFGTNNEIPVIISSEDATLPVELSSFTAVLTANMYVNLVWVTESETHVLGYNVYRSEDDMVNNASRLNTDIITATNTSEQHVYSMSDAEIETNHTYYYWVENVDFNGGNVLHGPQRVKITGNPTPVLPDISTLNAVYPNPFRDGQTNNISVSVKAGDFGKVTIYNVRGQMVKTFDVGEGNHSLTWDGKGCGSGIYFAQMSTSVTNVTKKIIKIK